MPEEPSTKVPPTPGQKEKREELAGAAIGAAAGLGCLGYGLIIFVVILGLFLLAWLIGVFSGPPEGG